MAAAAKASRAQIKKTASGAKASKTVSLKTADKTNAPGELSAKPKSKREQIVRAAVRVFLENGYAGTSMNRVAEEAGVIKATIYSHFADKEALFTGIVEEMVLKKTNMNFQVTDELLALAPEDFLDMMFAKFAILFEDKQYPAFFRVLVGESERFPELADIYVKTVILRGMEMATRYFDNHPELGLSDSAATAHIVAGSCISLLVWQRVLGGEHLRKLEFARVAGALKLLIIPRASKPL